MLSLNPNIDREKLPVSSEPLEEPTEDSENEELDGILFLEE
jgi:hypothetical protein